MPTYSKETALYDTGAIATDITEAGTKASKYLSSDSSGIMVYDGANGTQYPSTVSSTTNNVFIDDDSVDVRKGTDVLSSFGANSSIIGPSNGAHIEITSTEMIIYRNATKEIFRISLLNPTLGNPTAELIRNSTYGHGLVALKNSYAKVEGQETKNSITSEAFFEADVNASTKSATCGLYADSGDSSINIAGVQVTSDNLEVPTKSRVDIIADSVGLPAIDNTDNLFALETHQVFASSTISSGGHKYGTINVTKSGYYPLAIAGWNTPDAKFVPARLRLSAQSIGSATIAYDVCNVGNGSGTSKFNGDILWMKAVINV